MKLTERAIAALPSPDKRREIADDIIQGLYLVLQPSGAKSWAVRYRHGGKTRKATLGPWPTITANEARDRARKMLGQVLAGNDPEEKHGTVAEVFADFMARHVTPNLARRTAIEYRDVFRIYVLPAIGGRQIGKVDRRAVMQIVDGIAAAGHRARANRTFSYVRSFMGWAVGQGALDANPLAGAKPPGGERPRERVLSDPELAAVLKAARELGGAIGAFYLILAYTGGRRDEVASATWDEFDLDARRWTIPAARTKNGRAHDVHLADSVMAVIEELPRFADCPHLLTTNGRSPISGFSKLKARLDRQLVARGATLAPWRVHDLRRSAATGWAAQGTSLQVAERMLNHVGGTLGGLVGVYNRHGYQAECAAAWTLWARHLQLLEAGEAVIDLATHRK